MKIMKRYRNAAWMKRWGVLILCLCGAAMNLPAQYSDHRGFKIDSLEQVLQTLPQKEVETRARIYKDLMWAYSEINNDQSMKYAHLLAEISRQENYTLALANSLRVIGVMHYGKCEYDSALHYLNKSLEASARMAGDERYGLSDMEDEQAMAYGGIGNVYNMQGMNTLAIENYEKVMRICEKYQWNQSLATVYLNIAELYFGMENYRMAEEYTLRLDSLAKLTGDSLFIAKAHVEKGILYRSAYKDYDRALEHARAASDYLLDNPEEGTWQLTCLHLLTSIHLLKGNLNEAEKLIAQQLQLAEELESPYDIASVWAQQAELYSYKKEWSKVIEAGERALTYNDLEPENTLGVYKQLGEASARLDKTDDVLKYYGKALDLQTSWSNDQHQSSLAEQKVRYETEQKELRISSLEQEKRLMKGLAVSGGVIALFVALLFFYMNRLHRQQKRLLATQVALDSETVERKRIARDLHDGLGGMLSLVRIQLESGNAVKANELLDEAHQEMRRVAHHIMPESLMELGLVTAIHDLAAAIPHASFHVYGEEVRLEENVEVLLYRAVYELVNNALKHSGASSIDIQLIYQSDSVSLMVSDNGQGFDNIHTQQGFGLRNIRNRLAVYGGKILIESSPKQGAEIGIEIPIHSKQKGVNKHD